MSVFDNKQTNNIKTLRIPSLHLPAIRRADRFGLGVSPLISKYLDAPRVLALGLVVDVAAGKPREVPVLCGIWSPICRTEWSK